MPLRTVGNMVDGRRAVTCAPHTTITQAARLMDECRVGAVMVVKHGTLVGIFTERDALLRVVAHARDPRTTHVDEVMTPNPQAVTAEALFGHALHLMYEGGFRHVPVVRNGKPVGMVSARDALGPELEGFVAEVRQREHITEILG